MARRYDEFKVVEINNSLALRIGHVVAQQPLDKDDIEASGKVVPVSVDGYLDNGFFFKLDAAGAVRVPVDGVGPVYLGYSDALLDLRENYGLLKDFADKFGDDDVIVPRLVALYPGDVFTTDNFAGSVPAAGATAIAYVNFATGVLTIGAVPTDPAYVGPVFSVTSSTLPDGETVAIEALVVSVA
jgi:hypothetical protein